MALSASLILEGSLRIGVGLEYPSMRLRECLVRSHMRGHVQTDMLGSRDPVSIVHQQLRRAIQRDIIAGCQRVDMRAFGQFGRDRWYHLAASKSQYIISVTTTSHDCDDTRYSGPQITSPI